MQVDSLPFEPPVTPHQKKKKEKIKERKILIGRDKHILKKREGSRDEREVDKRGVAGRVGGRDFRGCLESGQVADA